MSEQAYSSARLMGLGLSAMLVPLGSTMIAVALPAIGTDFSRPAGDLTQWLVNSYLLINIMALGPGGKLGDLWGYRKTLRLGQFIFGLGCVLPLLLQSFFALVAARMLMALGGALMVPTVMAVFKITLPAALRHRVFGYFGALMGFAAALGPTLGGMLVHQFSWNAIFIVNLPPLALSYVFSRTFFNSSLNDSKGAAASGFDWPGTLLMGAGLVCLILGLKSQLVLLPLAAVLLAGFVWWQRKATWPLIDLALFANRPFAAGCAMVALQNLGMYALLFQLPYMLRLLHGWGPERAGPFMTTFMVSMMLASALGGRLAERLGVRTVCLTGSLTSVAGMMCLSLLSPTMSSTLIATGLVMGGVGLGLANGPSQSAAMSTVHNSASGVASGILSTCRYVGGVVGIGVLGLLLSGPTAMASFDNFRHTILVFAASFGVAALVSLALPRRH